MRDDNSQQKFEQDHEEEWYEYNRRILNEFESLTEAIRGKDKQPKENERE